MSEQREQLSFTILGAPRSPNRRGSTTQQRMRLAKQERDRAQFAATLARNKTRGWSPITGPARITFTVYRRRLLDPLSNLPASLKHYQDGICAALLPLGDGPNTPYEWPAPTQLAVGKLTTECVRVTVERLPAVNP